MKLQQDLVDFGKSKIQQWRGVLDELELQLALGKAEAKDLIREERKNISTFIEQQKVQMKVEEEKIVTQEKIWKARIEDLLMAIEPKLPETKRAFDKRKKDILHEIHTFEADVKAESDKFEAWLEGELSLIKDVLDDYRIRLALSVYDQTDGVEDAKNELVDELIGLMGKLNRRIFPGESRVDVVMEEISESFEHLKRAFSEMLHLGE